MVIYCDGSYRRRDVGGYACWAWVATDPGGQVVTQNCGCVGPRDDLGPHHAEYEAIIQALFWAFQSRQPLVTIRTDSQLAVKQIHDERAVNSPTLLPLARMARQILIGIGARIEWIPRTQNRQADHLARRAYYIDASRSATVQRRTRQVECVA